MRDRPIIDLDERAKGIGFRNLTSFVAIEYFDHKFPMTKVSKDLKVSAFRMRYEFKKRGWPIRKQKQVPRGAPKVKRSINVWGLVRENSEFIFPWCAIYVMYHKYLLTTYDIARALKISQPKILKLMRKYGIDRRNQGKTNTFNMRRS